MISHVLCKWFSSLHSASTPPLLITGCLTETQWPATIKASSCCSHIDPQHCMARHVQCCERNGLHQPLHCMCDRTPLTSARITCNDHRQQTSHEFHFILMKSNAFCSFNVGIVIKHRFTFWLPHHCCNCTKNSWHQRS